MQNSLNQLQQTGSDITGKDTGVSEMELTRVFHVNIPLSSIKQLIKGDATMSIEIYSQVETATKIKSIKGRNSTLRADIASVAASCFVRAAETGDLTLASKLHAAVSKSFQADIKRYFTTFGPIRFDSKTSQFKKVKAGGQFDMNALDVPFDAVEKPEKEAAEYNRDKELTSIVKFLDTKADRAITAGDDKMTALMLELAKAIATV